MVLMGRTLRSFSLQDIPTLHHHIDYTTQQLIFRISRGDKKRMKELSLENIEKSQMNGEAP